MHILYLHPIYLWNQREMLLLLFLDCFRKTVHYGITNMAITSLRCVWCTKHMLMAFVTYCILCRILYIVTYVINCHHCCLRLCKSLYFAIWCMKRLLMAFIHDLFPKSIKIYLVKRCQIHQRCWKHDRTQYFN